MVAIPLAVCALLFAMTVTNRPRRAALGGQTDERARLRGDLVNDIRTANQYCGVFVALLGVLATIAVSARDSFAPVLNTTYLWPFGVALVAAALATVFVPGGYGRGSFPVLQVLWFRSVLAEQITVVFTVYGIWRALGAVVVA